MFHDFSTNVFPSYLKNVILQGVTSSEIAVSKDFLFRQNKFKLLFQPSFSSPARQRRNVKIFHKNRRFSAISWLSALFHISQRETVLFSPRSGTFRVKKHRFSPRKAPVLFPRGTKCKDFSQWTAGLSQLIFLVAGGSVKTSKDHQSKDCVIHRFKVY